MESSWYSSSAPEPIVPPPTTSTTGCRDSRFSRSMNFVLLDTATGLPPKVRRCSRDPMERRLTSRRSTDEQRGQRRRFFQCVGSVFATERSTAESCKEGPRMSFLPPCPHLVHDAISNALTAQQCREREQFGWTQSGCRRSCSPPPGGLAETQRTNPPGCFAPSGRIAWYLDSSARLAWE